MYKVIRIVALVFYNLIFNPQTVPGETMPTFSATHWTVFVSRASQPRNVAKSARTLKPRPLERLVGNAAKPALTSAMTPRHVIRILRIDIRLYILNSLSRHCIIFVVLFWLRKSLLVL